MIQDLIYKNYINKDELSNDSVKMLTRNEVSKKSLIDNNIKINIFKILRLLNQPANSQIVRSAIKMEN